MRVFTIISLVFLLSMTAFAKKKGSPPMASGAPGDRTCNNSKCHAGSDINSGDAQIFIEGLPEVYTPDEMYTITLHVQDKAARAWGFQTTVSDSQGSALGSLKPGSSGMTQLLSNESYKNRTNREYITHTEKGIRSPKRGNSPTWQFNWQAPSEASGPSTFYFAFNVANGNKKKTGDHIYTRSLMVQAPVD